MAESNKMKDMPVNKLMIQMGIPMSMNFRADGTFVEDKGWHQAAQRYDEFIQRHKNLKIVFMELGVGYNTPGIIKYPFWQMTNAYPQASYICLNQSEAYAPAEIAGKSICMDTDISVLLEETRRAKAFNLI